MVSSPPFPRISQLLASAETDPIPSRSRFVLPRADRKEHLRSSQAVKQKKRSENISNKLEARKNAKKGIKPKGDKKGMKKGGAGGARGGFEGKKGPKHSGSKPSAGKGGE